MRRLSLVLSLVGLAVTMAAHIGSPNVVFDGAAGPYPVRVVVRPPEVVPGLAEVVVRAEGNDVSGVSIRPVFWRAGAKGAPAGDEMKPVPGEPHSYTGQLWLMAYGSYSVYVTVQGGRGAGTAIVPVASFATGRLPLSRGLGALLLVLGAALVAGLLTIVHAASGEALVSPGECVDASNVRRARLTTAIATPVLLLLLAGGAKWWNSEDGAYRRNMYGSPAAKPTVVTDATHRTLHLSVYDTASFHALFTPLMPDHGKIMHLFLVGTGGATANAFAHLHPVRVDRSAAMNFETPVPALPAGQYRLFADVLQESGLSLTVTNTVELPAAVGTVMPGDVDDAWSLAPAVAAAPGAAVTLGDGYSLVWTGTTPTIAANQPLDLTFEVRDAKGALVESLQPFLGMAAHAAIVRDDGSVFIHLHPMGTVTAAAQAAFAARDRGDTTARGRLQPDALDTATMPPMAAMRMSGALSFPYEFPKSGHYRIWVQVKPDQRILTGAFNLDVR